MVESKMPVFYRPFSVLDLMAVLQEVERRIPLAQVGRSRQGTGNLLVYDDGDYVGMIELHDPPRFSDFSEDDA